MDLLHAHRIVGWIFFVVFLCTGLYLREIFPDVYAADTALRFVYRANHVYILFASLLNIVASLRTSRNDRPHAVEIVASISIILSPLFFVTAFFAEVVPLSPARPLTLTGAFLSLLGVVLLSIPFRRRKTD